MDRYLKTNNAQDNKYFIPENKDRELVSIYRGWDKLEQEKHGNNIIDFDLAGKGPSESFSDRNEVREAIEDLLSRFNEGPNAFGAELVRCRLIASLTYLRALLGEVIPFDDYIEKTLWIKPEFFSEEILEDKREKANVELAKIPTKANDRKPLSFTKKDFFRFQDNFYTRNEETLPKQFAHFKDQWLPRLRRIIKIPLEDYLINVDFAKEDAYWKNWISGDLEDRIINLRINIHRRHTWYQGNVETLVLHEYCGHAVQMVKWHQQIKNNQLSNFFGILTVHFPDQFLLEGLGESISCILPEIFGKSLEKRSTALHEIHHYNLMVMNNVHILANIEKETQSAFNYARNHLPFVTEKNIQKEIRARTGNPLFRTYQYVYGIAMIKFLKAFQPLSKENKENLLKIIYTQPMTANQFQECAVQIAQKAP